MLVFLVIALLASAAAAYPIVAARSRELSRLDRRLGRETGSASTMVRRDQLISVPDMIAPLLARAQIELSARAIILGIAAVLLLAMLGLLMSGPTAALLALVGLPLAAYAYVSRRANRRIDALIQALPHYIDSVRQMQMVGSSLPQALERALLEAPDSVRSFMTPVARRLEWGAPVADTMQLLSLRLRVPEVAMLAAAIATNLRYGGSITAVLANLSNILRARLRVRREMDAATAQAKVSARILIAMPIVAMVLLMAVNPAYLDFFTGDRRGHTLAIVALCLQGMGMLAMKRMMRLVF
ncbi:MAG: type II secretion system F family protein [Sphingobium sp.]|nr:type II secretion system F family protein [Sphingobium sp.]